MDSTPRNYLNHRLAEGVRRVGFRKWYERELLSSHAHMVLTLLCAIALVAIMEVFHDAGRDARLLGATLFVVSATVGCWALRRYLYLLAHAENMANQASCGACGTYARFDVVAENRRDGHTTVCCRKCGQRWTIAP